MSGTPSDASKARLFNRMFICMDCNAHMRADPQKVRANKIKCRKCGNKSLRVRKRSRKTA